MTATKRDEILQRIADAEAIMVSGIDRPRALQEIKKKLGVTARTARRYAAWVKRRWEVEGTATREDKRLAHEARLRDLYQRATGTGPAAGTPPELRVALDVAKTLGALHGVDGTGDVRAAAQAEVIGFLRGRLSSRAFAEVVLALTSGPDPAVAVSLPEADRIAAAQVVEAKAKTPQELAARALAHRLATDGRADKG